MGYRSNVKITMKEDAFKIVNQIVKEQSEAYYKLNTKENAWAAEYIEHGFLVNGYLEEAPYCGEIVLSLDHVKWDNWYEDNKWFYVGLNHISNLGYGYIITTIGEDGATDIESNFDVNDDDFDATMPVNKDNIEPTMTRIFTESCFVVE